MCYSSRYKKNAQNKNTLFAPKPRVSPVQHEDGIVLDKCIRLLETQRRYIKRDSPRGYQRNSSSLFISQQNRALGSMEVEDLPVQSIPNLCTRGRGGAWGLAYGTKMCLGRKCHLDIQSVLVPILGTATQA